MRLRSAEKNTLGRPTTIRTVRTLAPTDFQLFWRPKQRNGQRLPWRHPTFPTDFCAEKGGKKGGREEEEEEETTNSFSCGIGQKTLVLGKNFLWEKKTGFPEKRVKKKKKKKK